MPSFGQSVDGRRRAMTAYRRAMRQALSLLPSATHSHRLAEIDAGVGALPEYHPARLAWTDVIQFQRSNPDVTIMTAPFGFTDTDLDDLFLIAMALEAGATEEEALAVTTG